ncbi:DUF1540 domain-containing protein [Bradyrhizobium sp. NBAIM08]|uniref:DUF1540 domain-containing protein n=1 Tax=Bradyrhizobium sp. NBAIM08 TaxID=2793815 RepID=UPI001CD4E727|nr:DUF1540 domain-containing protein [Bradyrhizobium sp. NBAIM08]MCA1482026.1 DUF1540 domain-containing protein [Bradyrhizobium sp. NBAIM08]
MATMMPAVQECTVTECAYNQGGCHAFAITVRAEGAACGTFIALETKGGMGSGVAQVGACSRTDCRHNADLECTADAVSVGPGGDAMSANCLTYEPA